MICIPCQLGLVAECYTRPGKGCKEKQHKESKAIINIIPATEAPNGRKHKLNNALLDPTSTGRKRAAVALPLKDEKGVPITCEWAGLKYAGGGEFPIIGCPGRPATNRHHGPDKDTTNNERQHPRNIHAICAHCHNRWHGLNDENYEYYLDEVGGPRNVRPHDSETRATPEEIAANEVYYASKRKKVEVTH